MKITVPITTYEEITLSEKQVYEIAVAYIKKKLWDHNSYYIQNNKLMLDVEYYTSHSWIEEEEIRDVTELDKAIDLVLTALYDKFSANGFT